MFLLFNVTKIDTFIKLHKLCEDIGKSTNTSVITILIGTNCDLIDQRSVSFQEAQNFANIHCIPYIEVSSLTGENIDLSFWTLIANVWHEITGQPTIFPHFPEYLPSLQTLERFHCLSIPKETQSTLCSVQ